MAMRGVARRGMVAVGPGLALVFGLGCSPDSSGMPPASAPAPLAAEAQGNPGKITGRVGGAELAVKRAIFMWRPKSDDMTLVLTDADDPCKSLGMGAWPTGATLLMATIKHNAPDNRDAPFAAGDYPLRQGSARMPQDTKQATFLKLDPSCNPQVSEKATGGFVRLSTPEVKAGGMAQGSFELTMADGSKLAGSFSASYCSPPDTEPRGCR